MKRSLSTHIRKGLSLTFFSFLLCVSAYAQTKRISGTVSDEKNEPLPGASIKAKSGNSSASTDANGKFTIDIPENEQVIVASFLGYVNQEVRISGRSTVSIKLQPGNNSLNEVVVVGYGTQRRQDVTGSVASVSAEKLAEVPAPNIIDQLKGRTAGVSIVSNGSTPGTAGQIRIRGNRTITTGNNDGADGPLIVLDGIPYSGSINDITPEDIVNVDILKDASSTAVFGSRGAGGIIQITTKRGRSGRNILSYDSYYAVASPLDEYPVYDGAGYAKLKADAAKYNRATPGTTTYGLTQAEQAALAAGVSTNWQDLIYQKNAPTQSHQLSVSGGSEKTQFSLGLGYYRQEGIIPNQFFNRSDLRSTLDHRINSRIKVGLNSINSLRFTELPGGGGVPGALVRTTPLASLYNADGTLNLLPSAGSIDAAAVSPYTLIARASGTYNRVRRIQTFNSFYGEVNILDGFKYRLQVGLTFNQENNNSYNGTQTFSNGNASLTNANEANGEQWNYNIQNLLYYNKVFAEKHRLDVTGLFEVTKDHNKSSSFNVTGIPGDNIQNTNFNLASGVITHANDGLGNFVEQGLVSYMGRVAYGYDDRYLLTATLRRDASSTLAPGNQWFTYPAFGLGWNISNEKFMENATFINNLKIRGGWGISGNRNVAPYSTLGGLNASAYNFGTTGQLAYTVSSVPNPTLGWQSTSQYDAGLEYSLFNNRISGNFDFYKSKTKDILLTVSLPPNTGVANTVQNLGKTENHGFEFNLTTENIKTKKSFNWSTDLNFSINREEITELSDPTQSADKGNGWFVGQPLNVIYDVKKIGIWQTEDVTNGALAKQTSPKQFPGQIRVEDLDGNGIINSEDRQIIGTFQPKWEGGLTNRFSYGAFDLSVVMYARVGMKVLLPYLTADGGANGFPFFNQSRVNQIRTNYWTEENPTNDFPAPDASTDRLQFGSTLGYHDGSFVKCRSINLGYNLPKTLISKIRLSSLRIYANATNPFIIYSPLVKSNLALDPEGNGYGGSVSATGGNTAVQGRQISVNLNNPPFRQFTFGLNAKF